MNRASSQLPATSKAEPPAHAAVNFWTTIGAGFREIWAHKFRSLLTMLGIILGVSSLVAMSALVKGMEKGAKEALVAIGGLEKVRVEPQNVPPEQLHLLDQAVGITMNDVYALQAGAPLVTRVSPEMRVPATVSANGKRFRPFICNGVWPVALEMSEHLIAHGRMFNELDDEMARSVCVIGTATRDELWGSPEDVGREIIPLGETLYINGVPFTIIGMFPHYESEQDRKARELAQAQAAVSGVQVGPARDRGRGGRGGRGELHLLAEECDHLHAAEHGLDEVPQRDEPGRTRSLGQPGHAGEWGDHGRPAPVQPRAESGQCGRAGRGLAANPEHPHVHAQGDRGLQLPHPGGLGGRTSICSSATRG
ncbi:MAG: ABC transporter permease [Verrucomicrobia bacterium]|nr:ABC transporter permease [Verrucomicrobiota bacterium]